jgi:cell volume regulation protein A
MAGVTLVQTALLLGAALVLVGILSSLVATRFGAPLLLVFLAIGMLAGEDGPGGISFDNFEATYLVGSFALAVILFDGGLRVRLGRLRGTLGPSLVLATVGVVGTAALTGLAAAAVLDVPLTQGLLLGSIVASTDAAAVLFLLQSGGLQLRQRVGTVLEVESGINDPAAIFLTVLLTEIVLSGHEPSVLDVVRDVAQRGVIGAAFGVGGGLVVVRLLNRIDMPSGLHPLLVMASAVLIFAAAEVAEGSGFLAVYLAGFVVGNRPVRAFPAIQSFLGTATWFCQIVMFVVLGLLVTPSNLLPYLLPALTIAAFLILVGRPLMVVLCLAPFRFSLAEIGFVSWIGLRGAVSIFLAAVPTLAGAPGAYIYFNVAFVVVLVSLLVQGWTLTSTARRLGLALPRTTSAVKRVELDLPGQHDEEMVGYPILRGSRILVHRALPDWVRPALVVRGNALLEPTAADALQAGDYAYFLVSPVRVSRLDRLFAASGPDAAATTFGELPVHADVAVGPLADFYGLRVSEAERALTVAELFAHRFEDVPHEGESLDLGTAILVVRAVEPSGVSLATLRLADEDEGRHPWRHIRQRLTARLRSRPGSASRRG